MALVELVMTRFGCLFVCFFNFNPNLKISKIEFEDIFSHLFGGMGGHPFGGMGGMGGFPFDIFGGGGGGGRRAQKRRTQNMVYPLK